ncbi:fimbria/pilus outer membrane usher protein [Paraburkholderia dinghuensis]|uniref:Fimbrial biogenesis outer membrane usher protein n=1 Tax=Paraburkholderia dinghuensis TaxID=2305225 RepID=A0A3N6MTJ1_9BURK|nr:fimbria/pilus outer membrane usher protein [Paraburkholderia dinghuensis]RQH07118.1 fimbrial biogenesis outer membrane usher protein [Paraburkholderia dinghuensis]
MKRCSYLDVQGKAFRPRLSKLCVALASVFLAGYCYAEEATGADLVVATRENEPVSVPVVFNSAFLRGRSGVQTDLSTFENDNGLLPGEYAVDIFLNGNFIQNKKISFKGTSVPGKTRPCISREFLVEAGVHDEVITMEPQQDCGFVEDTVKGGQVALDASRMRLDLTIPQAYLNRTVKGYVPRSAWDSGDPVAYVNYSGSYYHNSSSYSSNSLNSTYFYLQGGLNIGPWQLRNVSSVRNTPRSGTKFTGGNTYLQRALPDIRSTLMIGETSTSGTLFDSIAFRGIRLTSDERMLSPNQQGYAPVIRGTAGSNARVVVRQGASVVYETTVPPGEFVIDDLYPTQNSGDLNVQVTEASGQIHSFTVPFSAVSTSLRPGLSRYSLTAGRTNVSFQNAADVNFIEATYERGINNLLTVNGGLLGASNRYYSLSAGGVLATRVGAFGANVNFAKSDLKTLPSSTGWQFKGTYNATYSPTGTSVTLGAYRYSTSGYISLLDSLAGGQTPYYYIDDTGKYVRSDTFRQKSRFELSLNQPLGKVGSVYMNAIRQNYYGNFSANTQFQAGFQSSIGRVAYNIGFSRQLQPSSTLNGADKSQNIVTVGLVIPLDRILNRNSTLTTGVSHYSDEGSLFQTNLTGSFGSGQEYSYNINQSTDQRSHVNSGGASLSRNTSFGTFGAGYTKSTGSSAVTATARGVVVADRQGVLAGPYVGDTFGIIDAPGAAGAKLTSASGVVLNGAGRAIVPSLSPYRYNVVTLDPTGMAGNAELEETQKRVAPYAGAVPRIQFKTRRGYPLLISAQLEDGRTLPIGGKVMDAGGNEVGVVGQGSQLYARVGDTDGKLLVTWGQADSSKCTLGYRVPPQDAEKTLVRLQGVCQSQAGGLTTE